MVAIDEWPRISDTTHVTAGVQPAGCGQSSGGNDGDGGRPCVGGQGRPGRLESDNRGHHREQRGAEGCEKPDPAEEADVDGPGTRCR